MKNLLIAFLLACFTACASAQHRVQPVETTTVTRAFLTNDTIAQMVSQLGIPSGTNGLSFNTDQFTVAASNVSFSITPKMTNPIVVGVVTNVGMLNATNGGNSFRSENSTGGILTLQLGSNAVASGASSTAVGSTALASGAGSTAIGSASLASGVRSLAVGTNSTASDGHAVAIGSTALANGTNATAIGYGAIATNAYATAVGGTASATNAASAFGHGANASALAGIALGPYSVASGTFSVAIGYGISATKANQIVIGSSGQKTEIPGTLFVTGIVTNSNLTASRALVSGPEQTITNSTVTSTELGYLSGVTSAIQTQFDSKLATTNGQRTNGINVGIQTNTGAQFIGGTYTNSAITNAAGLGVSGDAIFSAATTVQAIQVNGAMVLASTLRLTPYSLQTLSAGNAIAALATKVRVAGNGGAITLTSTPTIAAGLDGDIVMILGTSVANTITVQDNATLAGSNLKLGATTRLIGSGDILVLCYDTTSGFWHEVSFANNVP